jgi:transposase
MALEPDLPQDPRALQQLVIQLLATLQERDRQIGQLSSQLEALKRRLFGRRSEKMDPRQLMLELGAWLAAQSAAAAEEAPAAAPVAESSEGSRTRPGHGRRRLPETLPRQRIEYHPLPEACTCRECAVPLKRIGEEVSEQLEYVPASFLVIEHARVQYACPQCQGNVVIGSLPVKPIDKGLPGPGLLAHVLTSKFADHLPLNRLEGIFARHGMELSRSTMCDWVAAAATSLEPVIGVMKGEVLASRKIHTDDTTVPVLDADRRSTRTGRLWVYLGDAEHPHVVFDYTPDRSRDGPMAFLRGYKGYLQADAYAGYNGVYAGQEVMEVACWAHARRKFFDAMPSDARRAQVALAHIRELYRIEKAARDLEAGPRQQLRVAEAKPVLETFKRWLAEQSACVLPKSPIGEAIGYARGQWQALQRYVDDGILDIDNNQAERALRRVAIGRKNWMFAGSDEGGRRAAIVYSVVASCAVLKINPYEYLRDVLARLPSAPPESLATLTPKSWKAALATTGVAA